MKNQKVQFNPIGGELGVDAGRQPPNVVVDDNQAPGENRMGDALRIHELRVPK